MDSNTQSEVLSRVISLYRFLYELDNLKTNIVTDLDAYQWHLSLSSLKEIDTNNIKIVAPTEANGDLILSVHKPDFPACPTPGELWLNALEDGWQDYQKEDHLVETLQGADLEDYKKWHHKRKSWQKKCHVIAHTREVFTSLFNIANDLERDFEVVEMISANGIFMDREHPKIHHPLVMRRMYVEFNAEVNTLYFRDSSRHSELYTGILQEVEGLNQNIIPHMRDELMSIPYHPVNDENEFLKRFTHELSSDSLYSENGYVEGWEKQARFLVYNEPTIILRRKDSSTAKAIENIIGQIEAVAARKEAAAK